MSRIKNLYLMLCAIVALPFRRSGSKPPRRILIVQAAKMGDMVCTTPMFRAAKEKYKDAQLFVMGNELNKELLCGNPHIDTYIVQQKSFFQNARTLRGHNIDFACSTTPNLEILATLIFARIPLVVVPKIIGGWSPYATKTYNLLSHFVTRVQHRMGSYAPQEYLKLLEPINIVSEDTHKELFFSQSTAENVLRLLEREKHISEKDFLVGIAPGVGNKIKVWGGDNFAHIAEALFKQYGATIVIIGGAADKEEVKKMLNALSPVTPYIDMSEKLSLEELKTLISRLQLFISVDTGPIYIAEAFGIPTIDIVGPMDEREQPPQGLKHRVVLPPHRKEPVLHIMNATVFDRDEARRQAQSVTSEMVLSEVKTLMENNLLQ